MNFSRYALAAPRTSLGWRTSNAVPSVEELPNSRCSGHAERKLPVIDMCGSTGTSSLTLVAFRKPILVAKSPSRSQRIRGAKGCFVLLSTAMGKRWDNAGSVASTDG